MWTVRGQRQQTRVSSHAAQVTVDYLVLSSVSNLKSGGNSDCQSSQGQGLGDACVLAVGSDDRLDRGPLSLELVISRLVAPWSAALWCWRRAPCNLLATR